MRSFLSYFRSIMGRAPFGFPTDGIMRSLSMYINQFGELLLKGSHKEISKCLKNETFMQYIANDLTEYQNIVERYGIEDTETNGPIGTEVYFIILIVTIPINAFIYRTCSRNM